MGRPAKNQVADTVKPDEITNEDTNIEESKPAPVVKKAVVPEGSVIGAINQKLTTGHSEDSTQRWEEWEIELRLKPVSRDGREISMPFEFYAVKKLRGNLVGADKTYQKINNQKDFRLVARPNYHVFFLPAGSVEVGQTVKCSTWFQTVGYGVTEKQMERILFVGIEKATGAPTN